MRLDVGPFPVDLLLHPGERLGTELELAVADLAGPEILDVLGRQRERGEVLDAGRLADLLRHAEPAARLEALDVLQPVADESRPAR